MFQEIKRNKMKKKKDISASLKKNNYSAYE